MNGGRATAIALLLLLLGLSFGCEDDGPCRPCRDTEKYPDTRILFGVGRYMNQAGENVEDTIYFDDGEPDTLPYNSRLYIFYCGYDNAWDAVQCEDPTLEMLYQFRFWRRGQHIGGGNPSTYETPWYPLEKAEDTRCHTNIDGTYMRIGTYEYRFMVRSFDDEYKSDGTPDTVRFLGNFPPVVDLVQIGYDEEPLIPEVHFKPISGDTLYIGLDKVFQQRPDTASTYYVEFDSGEMMYTYYYKIILKANGHDDHRDPPGSGIKAWLFSMRGPEDYYYTDEEEWVYDNPVNEYYQELDFRIYVPFDTETEGPDFSIINDPPGFLGEQELIIIGADISIDERFYESIRAISPVFDPDDPCMEITPGNSISVTRAPYRNARFDTSVNHFYIKLVR